MVDETVKLLVWACRRHVLTGDDDDLRTGPGWLAERLLSLPARELSRDILTVAVLEAQRAVEDDPELDGDYARCLALIAAFAAETRRRLDLRERIAA